MAISGYKGGPWARRRSGSGELPSGRHGLRRLAGTRVARSGYSQIWLPLNLEVLEQAILRVDVKKDVGGSERLVAEFAEEAGSLEGEACALHGDAAVRRGGRLRCRRRRGIARGMRDTSQSGTSIHAVNGLAVGAKGEVASAVCHVVSALAGALLAQHRP